MALRTSVLDWLATNRALRSVHEFTGVLWIPLGLAHLAALLLDETARIRVIDLVLPFRTEYGQLAIGLGSIALDVLIVVTITSWLRKFMDQTLWRWIHRLSYIAFGLLFVHGVLAGTDFSAPAVSALAWSVAFVVVVLSLARIVWGRLPA